MQHNQIDTSRVRELTIDDLYLVQGGMSDMIRAVVNVIQTKAGGGPVNGGTVTDPIES